MKIVWTMEQPQYHPETKLELRAGQTYSVPDHLGKLWIEQGVATSATEALSPAAPDPIVDETPAVSTDTE